MGKEVKIIIPDDCELVQTGVGKWEQRKMEKKLPKTWEEFCETHPVQKGECIINTSSEVYEVKSEEVRHIDYAKAYIPNKETAEAFLALCQLIQLRDCYNGDWEPDWSHYTEKYVIVAYFNDTRGKVIIDTDFAYYHPRVLTFKSEELRDQFLENFRDLIEIAKPLI